MRRYLLDTDVISALRRPDRAPRVAAWLRRCERWQLFLSVVTLAEIARGIERANRKDGRFPSDLNRWFDDLQLAYEDRILPVTPRIAKRWGRLSIQIGNNSPDLLIAATALEEHLVVATRNTRHFDPTGAEVLNPAAT